MFQIELYFQKESYFSNALIYIKKSTHERSISKTTKDLTL